MKTRREFLQGLIISVGGASALSACGDAATIVATAAGEGGRFYSADEMALISRISHQSSDITHQPSPVISQHELVTICQCHFHYKRKTFTFTFCIYWHEYQNLKKVANVPDM